MWAVWKQSRKRFARYHPETELIIRNQLKSTIASKSKGKNYVKGQNPQKAHLHPLRDVCMQYESNPANGFKDIVRKRHTDARPDMVMTISPAPTSWAGDKKHQNCYSSELLSLFQIFHFNSYNQAYWILICKCLNQQGFGSGPICMDTFLDTVY